jgi:hypothetical protein
MPQILLPYVIFEQRYKGTNFWWIYQIFKRLFSLKIELFLCGGYSSYNLFTLDIYIFVFCEIEIYYIILL